MSFFVIIITISALHNQSPFSISYSRGDIEIYKSIINIINRGHRLSLSSIIILLYYKLSTSLFFLQLSFVQTIIDLDNIDNIFDQGLWPIVLTKLVFNSFFKSIIKLNDQKFIISIEL